ncbi:hypothetical protein A2V49_00300 [candidate division WWE3 bacterium RBG_19FT_COMBO_34_6]|uniref:DNA-directed DNA polymerase n=1 Tax=candidate division WWE3 bacterium RBG_19FT_COMBO_34_6 TaxID=1802612 RepID=A0A1F4UJV5_UNCKA|nr:MAG: hypothetical protein A2V49_00300 [candidate division WWE3 bacterium RBG_19FT_COMBO_34_6]
MTKTFKFSNKEIVNLFKEVLAAMEVKKFSIFRIRAYQNVIITIEGLTVSVFNLWENNKLDEIPGVGPTLKSHMDELFTTGRVVEFDAIKHDLPQGMFELLGLRGIGAKKAYKLAAAFKLHSREDTLEIIKNAALSHKIQNLDGFGEKSEEQILISLTEMKKTKQEKPRMLLMQAEEIAGRITSYLKNHPEIKDAVVMGSYRRRAPTIGDLDIAIKTTDSQAALNYFLKYPEIEEVVVSGDKRVAVTLSNDIQVDIRVCEDDDFGSMMQYFTGSKNHNIILRTYALEHGCSLSEYGIKKRGELNKFTCEEDFYNFIKLPYIPPEIRHGTKEIELAQKNKLPNLIQITDLKGDLHSHTIASDGLNSFQEMVSEAIKLNYDYFGVSDHAPSIQTKGYDDVAKIIENTRRMIDTFNNSQSKIKVLFGYEVNILADSKISLPDELLKILDYAVASIHSSFNQDKKTLTSRLVAAARHPLINIIGHPSGRLINERESADIDWREFFIAAADNNKIIEINSQPNRLDLTEDLIPDALSRNIRLVINSDAHSTGQLNYIKYGIDAARRSWCGKEDIINTQNFDQIIRILQSSSLR